MNFLEKHPVSMILIGILGISLSSIFVKYSQAPSAVTAAWRLLWTVLLTTPVALLRRETRREIAGMGRKLLLLSGLSGLCLAIHFATWFESLAHTSVASSTTIVCTEVIWVCLGYPLPLCPLPSSASRWRRQFWRRSSSENCQPSCKSLVLF